MDETMNQLADRNTNQDKSIEKADTLMEATGDILQELMDSATALLSSP
jgi:hypothetical protein